MLNLMRFMLFFLLLQVGAATAATSLLAAEGRVLVFGRAQDDPVRAIRDRQEFVDYMAKKMAHVGISSGKILVVDNLHLLSNAIKEKKVDLFHDSPVPTMVLARQTGAIPILRQWKYGEAEYESVILARKGSGIENLPDLEGKVLGFDEPHSTSAHVVPRMLLTEKKMKLVHVKSTGAAKPKAVGYVFGSDGSAVNLLITGRVDAAATSLREYEELRPEIRDSLKIVGKTMSVPRQLIAVRKDLDPKLVKALREVLLAMDSDPEGQQVLKRQQRSTKIDEIPPSAMQQLRSIERFVFSMPEKVNSW